MDTDALKSARAVRQPVSSTSDADEAFDDLTYEKGAAVLRMIEGFGVHTREAGEVTAEPDPLTAPSKVLLQVEGGAACGC